MRRKIVAGNWKMNKTWPEALSLVASIHGRLERLPVDVELIIAVPFTYIKSISDILEPGVKLAAQDCSAHDSGAFTGEVSARMLASCGIKYCIVGHSERRSFHGESDDVVLAKTLQLLQNKITPIFCCGELLDDRQNGIEKEIVKQQISTISALDSETIQKIVIAYEPVWAIGTGLTATDEQAQDMHAFIRSELKALPGSPGNNMSILYGGSCKPENAKSLFSMQDIDGGLIGGSSLKAEDFIQIAEAYGN